MRTQKKEEISGEMNGAYNSDTDEWRRLCARSAAISGASRACFVFFFHHASVVAAALGQRFKGWQDKHSLALWRQQRFYCPLTSHELQLDGSCGYLAVPVIRKHIRGLLLLEFDVSDPSLTAMAREQLDLLAEHGALLWQEQKLEAQLQDEDISSGRFMNRLKSLFLRVPVLINGFDAAGRCILWNNECERVFGWRFEELEHQAAPIEIFYPDAEERQRVIGTFREMHGTEFREWHPVDRNGHRLTTLWANIMLPNGDMICVGHDITEQRTMEVQQQLAASVFEASYDGIMLTDAANRVLKVNPSFTRITGYTQEDVAGHISTLFRHKTGAGPHLPADAQSPDHWQGECVIRRRNNTECHLLLSVSVIRDQQASVQHHVLILTDISHIKQHEAELRQRALYDSLTGIPNRQLFSELLDRALAAATRNGTMVAVCYLDLDGFKQINDTLGHAAGDKLLVEAAGRMVLLLRSSDAVARLGGDEFALMITGLHHALECSDILERMLSAINAPFNPGSHQVRVSASIGVAVYPEDSREGESLLCYADKAMYDAKKQGKSRYVFFEPALHSEDQARHRLYAELLDALINDEFVLHYQPKIDLFSRSMTGLEALLRWQHPERGLLTPVEFLPVVLDSDIEFELGQWVIRRLLQQMTEWSEAGHDYHASFNVSAGQLLHPEFCHNLEYLLARYAGVQPGRLELEFQENAVQNDLPKLSAVLEHCRRLGLKISLDNFGAEHASLINLKSLPVDILKIDRSFITDLLTNPADACMVEGVVQLATALQMLVVAEGMEVPELGKRLQQLGCHYVQGYGISHPMPASAINDWLVEWNRPLQ